MHHVPIYSAENQNEDGEQIDQMATVTVKEVDVSNVPNVSDMSLAYIMDNIFSGYGEYTIYANLQFGGH